MKSVVKICEVKIVWYFRNIHACCILITYRYDFKDVQWNALILIQHYNLTHQNFHIKCANIPRSVQTETQFHNSPSNNHSCSFWHGLLASLGIHISLRNTPWNPEIADMNLLPSFQLKKLQPTQVSQRQDIEGYCRKNE